MFYTNEDWKRINKITAQTLNVCEYCEHFCKEKMKCVETNNYVGLYSSCENFKRIEIS